MNNLGITHELVKCEHAFCLKLEKVTTRELLLFKEGFFTNDNKKLKEALFIYTVTSTEYYLFRASGSFISHLFIQSIIKNQSINNDLLSDTIYNRLKTDKDELISHLESTLKKIDSVVNDLLTDSESLRLIVDYGLELKNFRKLVNESLLTK